MLIVVSSFISVHVQISAMSEIYGFPSQTRPMQKGIRFVQKMPHEKGKLKILFDVLRIFCQIVKIEQKHTQVKMARANLSAVRCVDSDK